MVVPFAPGGATDIAARLVVPALAEALSRPVLIENRGGGGTLIGAEAVATAAPDGNTIGFFTITTAALAPALHREPPLRHPPRLRAAVPRRHHADAAGGRPARAGADLAEFLALLRDSPKPLTYGSAGPGSINHLSAHMLAMRAAAGPSTSPIAAPRSSCRT